MWSVDFEAFKAISDSRLFMNCPAIGAVGIATDLTGWISALAVQMLGMHAAVKQTAPGATAKTPAER